MVFQVEEDVSLPPLPPHPRRLVLVGSGRGAQESWALRNTVTESGRVMCFPRSPPVRGLLVLGREPRFWALNLGCCVALAKWLKHSGPPPAVHSSHSCYSSGPCGHWMLWGELHSLRTSIMYRPYTRKQHGASRHCCWGFHGGNKWGWMDTS